MLKVNGVQWMENNAGIMFHTWGRNDRTRLYGIAESFLAT
jgi:hypothetical protein